MATATLNYRLQNEIEEATDQHIDGYVDVFTSSMKRKGRTVKREKPIGDFLCDTEK